MSVINTLYLTWPQLYLIHVLGISGWLPEPLAHQIMHNRTVNLAGGLGRNIPMDRVNEFYNKEFKGKNV